MKIYNKIKEINKFIGKLLISIDYLEMINDSLKIIAPELNDKLKSIIKSQKSLVDDSSALMKSFEKEEKDSVLNFIKNGNIIHFISSDGVSYTEHQFYHILNATPDWRGMIKYEIVTVGQGETGKWIRHDNVAFKELDEFIVLLNNHNHNIELVDHSTLEKYINYSKNIPQC